MFVIRETEMAMLISLKSGRANGKMKRPLSPAESQIANCILNLVDSHLLLQGYGMSSQSVKRGFAGLAQ